MKKFQLIIVVIAAISIIAGFMTLSTSKAQALPGKLCSSCFCDQCIIGVNNAYTVCNIPCQVTKGVYSTCYRYCNGMNPILIIK